MMTLELAGLAGICILIIVANLEQRRRDSLALPTLSLVPRSKIDRFWHFVGALCHRLDDHQRARFEPGNLVHRLAVLLMVMYAALVFARLSQGEDTSGISILAADEVGRILQLATTIAAYLGLALLGAGWLTRRSFAAVIQRLDLRSPNRRDWLEGLVLASGLFLLAQAGVALWARSAPPAVFEMQTFAARQIFESFNVSLAAGLVLALTSAVGEEILFRGALQPVFGIVISSLFFVLLHTQYFLTPAALILFAISLGLGWLRYRRCTSAAIICHAAYNLLPFVIHRLAG